MVRLAVWSKLAHSTFPQFGKRVSSLIQSALSSKTDAFCIGSQRSARVEGDPTASSRVRFIVEIGQSRFEDELWV